MIGVKLIESEFKMTDCSQVTPPRKGCFMSHLLVHFWPGGTEAHYQAAVAAVHPPGLLPVGQTYHAAGPAEGGYLIVSVWESKEAEERFVQQVLLPAQPIAGGFPHPVVSQQAPIVNLFTA